MTGATLARPHVVPGRPRPASDLTGKRVAVVKGRRDPMATVEQTAALVGQLRERGATVEECPYDGGHSIDPAVLPDLRGFLARP